MSLAAKPVTALLKVMVALKGVAVLYRAGALMVTVGRSLAVTVFRFDTSVAVAGHVTGRISHGRIQRHIGAGAGRA